MNIGGALVALVADASYGLPLLIALGITVGVAWWSRRRTSELPLLLPTEAPEYWRIQIDSRAYFTLQQGRYLVAVDGLGRRLATVVRERFHLRIDISTDLHSAAVDHVLPRPLTLRGLVADLTRAYYSAFWAEEPGWLAQRWSWLHHRDERRAARDFVRVTHALSLALPALEAK